MEKRILFAADFTVLCLFYIKVYSLVCSVFKIILSRHEQLCLIRLRSKRYFFHYRSLGWKKYLLKPGLITPWFRQTWKTWETQKTQGISNTSGKSETTRKTQGILFEGNYFDFAGMLIEIRHVVTSLFDDFVIFVVKVCILYFHNAATIVPL